jgi:AraC-like DNA-binding protein
MLLINNSILLSEYEPIFEAHNMEPESLPFIFHFNEEEGGCIFNLHENVEFLYFKSGPTRVMCGSEMLDVSHGDIVMINPYVTHRVMKSEGCCHCLIVDKSFLMSNGIDQNEFRLDALIKDERARELFMSVEAAYRSEGALRTAEIRAAVISFVLYVYRTHSAIARDEKSPEPPRDEIIERTERAIKYINGRLSSRLTVEEIAKHLHISKYHFLRQFKRVTGMTVIGYVRSMRCEYAKRLLSSGIHTVKEAALLAGFDNASYFTATFKEYVGMTPREYLKSLDKKQF